MEERQPFFKVLRNECKSAAKLSNEIIVTEHKTHTKYEFPHASGPVIIVFGPQWQILAMTDLSKSQTLLTKDGVTFDNDFYVLPSNINGEIQRRFLGFLKKLVRPGFVSNEVLAISKIHGLRLRRPKRRTFIQIYGEYPRDPTRYLRELYDDIARTCHWTMELGTVIKIDADSNNNAFYARITDRAPIVVEFFFNKISIGSLSERTSEQNAKETLAKVWGIVDLIKVTAKLVNNPFVNGSDYAFSERLSDYITERL